MWATTQINEITLTVCRRSDIMPDLVIHDFNFEFVRSEHLSQRRVIIFLSYDFVIRSDMLLHLLLYVSKILVPYWIHVEVVVESMINRWTDRWFCFWKELHNSLGK